MKGKPFGNDSLRRGAAVALLLMVGLGLLFSGVLRGRVELEGRTVSDWLEEISRADYAQKLELEQMLVEHAPESLQGLITELDTTVHPLHALAVKVWANLSSTPIRMPDRNRSRAEAARLIGLFGNDATPALPVLMDAAAESTFSISEAARVSLIRLGDISARPLAKRLAGRYDDSAKRRWISILKSIGASAGPEAVEELIRSFGANPVSIQVAILGVFESRPFQGDAVSKLLVATAEDTGNPPETRAAALRTMSTFENPGPAFRQAVQSCLSSDGFGVRFHAAAARCRWGWEPREVLPLIIEGLQHDRYRVTAVGLLGDLGADAATAIDSLLETLVRERSPRPLRSPPSAGVALSRIGTDALPGLIEMLEHPDPFARLNAVVTLGVFGRRAAGTAAQVVPLLADPDLEVRQAAALALSNLGHHTREAIPVLLELAEDDDPFLATWAGEALAEIDPSLTAQGAR